MRRLLCLCFVLLMLCGCSGKDAEIQRAIDLRMKLLNSGCTFDAEITADYGDEVYEFSVSCEGDSEGNLAFSVTEPESIAGITGLIDQEGGKLTFEDTALTFPLLADGQVSPVSAPWIFLKTLRGGYLSSAGIEGDLLHLTIDDSYEENAMQLDIWLNAENIPVRADILYDGCRILALTVNNFQIQ